jgi:predicted DNA binding CopG/RHH family protein
MKKKLPKFKSESEEARFWSEHSPLDYPDDFKDVENPFQFSISLLKRAAKEHREKKRSLTFRMEESQIFLAKIIAKKYGDHYQTLMRKWVRERIFQELKQDPSIEREIRKQHIHLVHKA